MGWFGRKAAGRDDSRPVLSRVGASVPVIGEWPRSYEAQVRDAYLGNAVAQRAVRLFDVNLRQDYFDQYIIERRPQTSQAISLMI